MQRLLIETLRIQIARPSTARRAGAQESDAADEVRGVVRKGRSCDCPARSFDFAQEALEELEAEASTALQNKPVSTKVERPAPVRSFPPHLPREEIIHEPLQGSCTCPDCGGTLRKLSVDSDEMLDVVPVHWRVIRHVRPKYSCRSCEKIIQAPAPVKAIARGKAAFATLAHVVVSKFDHHLPLYRQAEMMAADGIEIDRSTLAGLAWPSGSPA